MDNQFDDHGNGSMLRNRGLGQFTNTIAGVGVKTCPSCGKQISYWRVVCDCGWADYWCSDSPKEYIVTAVVMPPPENPKICGML